jgi:hypothetical protein
MIYNWKVTNLFTLDEGTKTDYVVTALYNVTGIETVAAQNTPPLYLIQHSLK